MSLDSRSGSTFLIRKIIYSVALRYPEPSKDLTSLSYRGFGIGIFTYSTMMFPSYGFFRAYLSFISMKNQRYFI